MNIYDGVFILRPDLKDEEFKNNIKLINEAVVKNGGAVIKEEIWGKKQLAYRIKKVRDGQFYKSEFSAPSDALAKISAMCKLNADIMRIMITKK